MLNLAVPLWDGEKVLDHSKTHARFVPASDQSLLVSFGDAISVDDNLRVQALLHAIEQCPIAGVRNLHPACSSLLVVFDAMRLDHAELEARLREYVERSENFGLAPQRTVEIPVCYDVEFGLDLDEVAAGRAMSPQELIALHCSREYMVYFLGFVPGFAYLGDLPAELETPRLAAPRRMVPRGSVAIAGRQTAVYPLATPGGWRILGRTPLAMIEPEHENMSVLRMGDRVRFAPISRDEFDKRGEHDKAERA